MLFLLFAQLIQPVHATTAPPPTILTHTETSEHIGWDALYYCYDDFQRDKTLADQLTQARAFAKTLCSNDSTMMIRHEESMSDCSEMNLTHMTLTATVDFYCQPNPNFSLPDHKVAP